MGYKFQFITLAGFHALNYSMFELAYGYARNNMTAFVELQQKEFAAAEKGFTAVKHQREVGTGYFDDVTQVVQGGQVLDHGAARLDRGRAVLRRKHGQEEGRVTDPVAAATPHPRVRRFSLGRPVRHPGAPRVAPRHGGLRTAQCPDVSPPCARRFTTRSDRWFHSVRKAYVRLAGQNPAHAEAGIPKAQRPHPFEGGVLAMSAHHRVGPAGNPGVPAPGGVRQAGQRLRHGRLPGAVRRGGARLRGLLGAAGARAPALAQAVHQGARRVQRAVLQVVPRRRAERLLQLPRPAPARRSPTRSRSSSRPTTARSRRSPTSSSTTRSASSPTR